jgi:hypothetical protein
MTFQPPSRSLTPRDYQFIALVVVLFLVIASALVYANLTLPRGGGDFLVHWVGARAFLFEQTDPYSGYVPARVQELVYDGRAGAGDKPYILDTPFHILLLYFPLTLLPDPQLARAIFTLILQLALFALALFSLRLTDWEAPRWFIVLFFLFCIFNVYAFQAIVSASPVLLLAAIYAGILIALRAGQDELTGALMAISVYYWEVGLPFLILVIWRVYKEGRIRVFAGFFMLSFILLVISFFWYPDWILPNLRAGMNNLRADFGLSTHTVLAQLLPSYGGTLSWILIGILVVVLGYEWNTAFYAEESRFYWACCVTLAITPLLGFRTMTEHLAVLVIPLVFLFSILRDRWHRVGNALVFFFLMLLFLFPWAAYLFRFGGDSSQEIVFLFLPLFTVIGLYWMRWWALRPPRTWVDLANRHS